jgi:hypothetical protein
MISPSQLDLVRRGDAITAKLHNQSKLAIMRMKGVGPARQVIGHPIGGAEETQPASIRVLRFGTLIDEGWMQCWDVDTGAMVNVAMPVELRKDIWNGTTKDVPVLGVSVLYLYGPTDTFPEFETWRITRRIARIIDPNDPQAGREFIEEIVPDYRYINPISLGAFYPEAGYSGEWDGNAIIVAGRTGPDGTGLVAPVDHGEGPVDELVVWTDLNWAGRGWVMVPPGS